MYIKYLCKRWQGLLEMMVNLIGNGYYDVHITYLPEKKMDKWKNIDEKLIRKYKADLTKDQRYQRKKKGLAHFRYLRWENIAIIMHTPGDIISPGDMPKFKDKFNQKQLEMYVIEMDDRFTDVRQNPIFLRISDEVIFDIRLLPKKEKGKNVATVRFAKSMIKDIKADLEENLAARAKNKVLYLYGMLNGVPAWRGIIIQKRALKRFILQRAKKHHVTFKEEDLYLNDFRKKEDSIFEENSS